MVKAFTALTWYRILDDSVRRDKPRRGDRIVAQGVSPGYMSSHLKAPEGRKKSPILEVSVAPPGLAVVGFVTQGLRPGLQFYRPSGTGLRHGLKPILPFGATILSSVRTSPVSLVPTVLRGNADTPCASPLRAETTSFPSASISEICGPSPPLRTHRKTACSPVGWVLTHRFARRSRYLEIPASAGMTRRGGL